MKPYGLPRHNDVEFPDVADIHAYARKSSVGKLKSKGGDFRGYHKNKSKKRATRRYWKRKARAEGKKICNNPY